MVSAHHRVSGHAVSAVRVAVKEHRLLRGKRCEICGAEGRFDTKPSGCRMWTLSAHHDDYGEPLSVRWLCLSCHMKLHYRLQREGKDPRYLRICAMLEAGEVIPESYLAAHHHKEWASRKNGRAEEWSADEQRMMPVGPPGGAQ